MVSPGAEEQWNSSFLCVRDTDCFVDPFSRIHPTAPVFTLKKDTVVEVIGRDSGLYFFRLADGRTFYCACEDLESLARRVHVPHAVDLREYIPALEFELLFASPHNITGEALYAPVPLLECNTAELLLRAEEQFLADGCTLKIYDAYRPQSAQFRLYDLVRDARFIGNPYEGLSMHQLGRAVDVSLVDLSTGMEREMPTPMHTFAELACRSSVQLWSAEAKANIEYLTAVMRSVGFSTIQTEWWHFQNETAYGSSLAVNMDLTAPEYTVPVFPAGDGSRSNWNR